MDVRDDSAAGDGGLDQGVEFLVTADRELQMAGGDALDLEVLAGVAGQFEDFGRQILEDRRRVDCGRRTDAVSVVDRLLQEPVHSTDGELQPRLGRARLRRPLRRRGLPALPSFASFSTFAGLFVGILNNNSNDIKLIVITKRAVSEKRNRIEMRAG